MSSPERISSLRRLLLSIALFLLLSMMAMVFLDLLADRRSGRSVLLDPYHSVAIVLVMLTNLIVMGRIAVAVRTMDREVRQANEQLETARARAEDELRLSEQKYCLLFENMAEGFALYELIYDEQDEPVDWRVLEVNDAYTRHTGITRDQIAGKRISELFPAAIPEYLPRFASVVKTQTPIVFDTYARAVGRHQHIFTFPAGGNRFASTIEDVSERHRVEEEIRKQAVILAQVHDAVIVMDKDWRITFLNDAAEKLYGYTYEEVVGRAHNDFPVPDFVGTTPEELVRRLQELGEAEIEFTRLTKDGRRVWIESRASMIRGSEDGFSGSIWVDRDITARRQAEEALRRAENELMLAGQERAALAERQRLAIDLHDSVSQALYGISLGANTVQTMLDVDEDKARNALDLTLSLINAAQAEMRRLIIELRPDTLGDEGLAPAMTRLAEQLGANRDVRIELSVGDEPNLPPAAKEALFRIAQEAIRNAIKHARSDRIDVSLTCNDDGCRLDVGDDGVGFDPLAPFPGHLGLHSMRERAAGVGGTLTITSAPERGTHICVDIPLARQ